MNREKSRQKRPQKIAAKKLLGVIQQYTAAACNATPALDVYTVKHTFVSLTVIELIELLSQRHKKQPNKTEKKACR